MRVGEPGGATTTPPCPFRKGDSGGGGILGGEVLRVGLAGPGPPPAMGGSVEGVDATGFIIGVLGKVIVIGFRTTTKNSHKHE